MTQLFLPRHVYFCGQGSSIVFLDLRSDRYSRIDGELAAVFGSLVHGPSHAAATQPALLDTAGTVWLEGLKEIVERRLLTTDANVGKPILPTFIECPTERLTGSDRGSRATGEITGVRRFLSACISAWARLRFQSIEKVVTTVSSRRHQSAKQDVLDIDYARQLVERFGRLRAVFPVNHLCLFDSLALIEFLACYGVFSRLVFGIRLDPWAAHCWVQECEFVFNDDVEVVSEYIPIMAT